MVGLKVFLLPFQSTHFFLPSVNINLSLLKPGCWKVLILPVKVKGMFLLFPMDIRLLPDQSWGEALPLPIALILSICMR